MAETDLPAAMVSILTIDNARMRALISDPRLPVVSFTGSGPVGRSIQQQAAHKHVTLELGGDAAVVVHEDWPDLAGAAERIALFGNYQAGQSCVSVQRVLVHESVYDRFVPALVAA
ncbi:aldehyde dehydrogenase family protein, partial [Nitrosomonas communis]|uniref:aldehyde dehydrogenase family protein n=1 Tax=Nitrosomonas communis TaxID=44574 RepID=UPI003D28F742